MNKDMNVDKTKIKNARTDELIEQLSIIEEEMADRMFPLSYAASQRLRKWQVEIKKELWLRGRQ